MRLGESTTLARVVFEIIQERPEGMKHVEVVQELLRRGHGKEKGISAEVHAILSDLVRAGAIARKESQLERRYTVEPHIISGFVARQLKMGEGYGTLDAVDYVTDEERCACVG